MAQWRIRVVVPDGPGGHQALTAALAQVPCSELQVGPAGSDEAGLTGDVVVELREEDSLGDLLRTLHEISPQVFISRVGAADAEPADGRKVRVRKLRRTAGIAG